MGSGGGGGRIGTAPGSGWLGVVGRFLERKSGMTAASRELKGEQLTYECPRSLGSTATQTGVNSGHEVRWPD